MAGQVGGQAHPRSVLVVDDHRAFAEMLGAALDGVDGLVCVGTASTADEGVELAARLRPDVVVMDIEIGHDDGLAATARVRQVAPGTLVAVFTAHAAPDWVARAAQAGASAFVGKTGSLDELVGVLRGVRGGQLVVAPSAYLVATGPPSELPAPVALSGREREVLALLAAGTTVRDLAAELGITLATAQGYVKSLRRKLGAGTQLDAVVKARERGLLDHDR
ncbi:response regulator transcription factor [Microlunatus flavus]|uniref:DNA-binding response regulator, NarL/FixJ family, contains REC and HTH domains n=1 Tax=Microlunatus flavus TaxID=1036181 RepID=A0A1H9GA24_9ACTN|nr:response regulator transcription factor [Microlunatus flavus]SEQ46853.1 DNA-binding response regulator, NarL/FixJ family, contains REC and HTH domains [Microlunatus flavus]